MEINHPFANNNWTEVNNKYYHWIFTHYDVDEDTQTKLLLLPDQQKCKYIIFGRETCPTSGRKHLQGFISFTNQVRRSSVAKLLGDCFIKPMVTKGSTDACIEYCKKDGDWIERGTPSLTSKRAEGMLNLLGELQDFVEEHIDETNNQIIMSIADDIAFHAFDLLAYFNPDHVLLQCDTDDETYDSDIDMSEDELALAVPLYKKLKK